MDSDEQKTHIFVAKIIETARPQVQSVHYSPLREVDGWLFSR